MSELKFRKIMVLAIAFMFFAIGAGEISAFNTDADLEVDFRGQNSPYVYSPYTYRIKVNNIGGSDAQDVKLTVVLPLTDTSPTQHILGNVSGVDNKCQVVSNKLECDLGKIKANKRKTVRFNFEFPVSTKTLEMKATASTISAETNTTNNVDTKTPNFRYISNSFASADILNSYCTGQNLTSYFECALFPSSITQHSVMLESNGTITFTQPGYSGSWYKPTPKELHFEYSDGTNTVLEFNGFATSASCFEGLSTFPNTTSGYVSAYKVCVQ